MRRGFTSKTLAKIIDEEPRVVSTWIQPSGYTLELTENQLLRLARATSFLPQWFTGGDEEADFAAIDEIDASMRLRGMR